MTQTHSTLTVPGQITTNTLPLVGVPFRLEDWPAHLGVSIEDITNLRNVEGRAANTVALLDLRLGDFLITDCRLIRTPTDTLRLEPPQLVRCDPNGPGGKPRLTYFRPVRWGKAMGDTLTRLAVTAYERPALPALPPAFLRVIRADKCGPFP